MDASTGGFTPEGTARRLAEALGYFPVNIDVVDIVDARLLLSDSPR
jgi:hypothetical protein